jgi:hypothetical protein
VCVCFAVFASDGGLVCVCYGYVFLVCASL